MPKPADPVEIVRRLASIGEYARNLADEYQWDYELAFGRGGGGLGPGKRAIRESDSTGVIAVEDDRRESMRAQLAEATRQIRAADGLLSSALGGLEKESGRVRPRDSVAVIRRERELAEQATRGVPEARKITVREKIETDRAAERRKQRGEGWGRA